MILLLLIEPLLELKPASAVGSNACLKLLIEPLLELKQELGLRLKELAPAFNRTTFGIETCLFSIVRYIALTF